MNSGDKLSEGQKENNKFEQWLKEREAGGSKGLGLNEVGGMGDLPERKKPDGTDLTYWACDFKKKEWFF